ncbi:conserved exported protein of unknown function [Burkholderia multivorans]
MKRILLCALALLTTASIAHAQTDTYQFGEGQAQPQSAQPSAVHPAHRAPKHAHTAHSRRKHAAHKHAVHRMHRKHHAAPARKRT